VDLLRSSVF